MTYSTNDLSSGDILDGRFEILELISQGRWSSVFKAIDISTGRHVVVKVPPRYLGGGQYCGRLRLAVCLIIRAS